MGAIRLVPADGESTPSCALGGQGKSLDRFFALSTLLIEVATDPYRTVLETSESKMGK